MDCKIALIEVPRALREFGVTASYHRVWNRVIDGRIPATKVGKRWMIARSDLPAAADLFKPSTK